MKYLVQFRHFSSIVVARSKEGISIFQRKYVIDFLEETGTLGTKAVDTPVDPNVRFL